MRQKKKKLCNREIMVDKTAIITLLWSVCQEMGAPGSITLPFRE
jgi:hypothetical protein